jgi:pimeloyl-ACP methyl ester carboxylesterase
MSVITAAGQTVELRHGGQGMKVIYLSPYGPEDDDMLASSLAEQFEVYVVPVASTARNAHEAALAHDDILRALALTNVPVIGAGSAAVAAAELAAHFPARVSKLVIIDPLGEGIDGLLARLYRIEAPTRIIRGADAPEETVRLLDAAAAGIRSCDAVIADGSIVERVDEHLRSKAPGARDGLIITHVDDLEWKEVRVMLVNGVRSVVKNRFIDFGEHRTICHTWYDPGIALARHSHYSEELIYVLSGGLFIDTVWCPEGTVIVLEPGTYFGPLIAGPDGAYIFEAFRGIGIRSGQDRAGFDVVRAERGIEPLPDPPFDPPIIS